MSVVRWTFTDVFQTGVSPYTWTFTINPNQGGTPSLSRPISFAPTVGNRRAVASEGSRSESVLPFSGVILSRAHLEALELWQTKRILLELHDDLGRAYRGVFNGFTPQRVRKTRNFWYHTYDAQFSVLAYRNASGAMVFGDAFTPISQPVLPDDPGQYVPPGEWDGGESMFTPVGTVDGGTP